MPQLTSIPAFDQDHFPIGTAILIESKGDEFSGKLDPEVGIIIGYLESHTLMKVLTRRTAKYGGQCISARSIGHTVVLTRLIPEPDTVEDMDYKAAVDEINGCCFIPPDNEVFEPGGDNYE